MILVYGIHPIDVDLWRAVTTPVAALDEESLVESFNEKTRDDIWRPDEPMHPELYEKRKRDTNRRTIQRSSDYESEWCGTIVDVPLGAVPVEMIAEKYADAIADAKARFVLFEWWCAARGVAVVGRLMLVSEF